MSTEHLLGDFGAILHVLIGTADEPRQEAEKHLRGLCVQFPGDCLLLLAQIGAQGVGGFQLDRTFVLGKHVKPAKDYIHRLLALVLLRRIAFEPLPGLFLNETHQHASAPFDCIGERMRSRIETVLCAGLTDEMDPKIRRGLGDCVATWTTQSSNRQRPCYAFPEVLLGLMRSSDANRRFTAWQVINLAPTLMVDSVRDPIGAPHMARSLAVAIADTNRYNSVEAIKAMRSVVLEGLTGQEREEIGARLVFEAFKALQTMASRPGSDPANPLHELIYGLEPLVDLASTYPALFHDSFDTAFPFLLSLVSPPSARSTNYPFSPYPASSLLYEAYEEIANPATEILLSLAELRSDAFVSWQAGRAARELVGMLMGRLVAGLQDQDEESREWLDDELDEEDETYPVFPEEALDRLALSLGGDVLLPALSHHVHALLHQPDWRCRYAALAATGSVADGCSEQLQQGLPDVLKLISTTTNDPHPRVRYAFLQCMGQFCQNLEETLQKQYPKDTLGALLHLLKDPEARVRAHAGACMVNFFNDSDVPALVDLLQDVVRSLLDAFHAGPLYLQEQLMATLAAVATHAGSAFGPYYREIMDLVMSVLMAPSDEKHRKLVGRAIECGSLIGLAMGKAAFAADATKLAAIMIAIQNSISASDDPRTVYLVEAWACFCRTLGQDFKPFLPHVIPPLLKAAAYKPASPTSNLSLSEEEAETFANVHTAEMDEKILAFDNLTVYAHTMGSAFQPYLDRCMELTLEALTFPYSEDVRESAAFLVPALLQVAKESNAWAEASGPLHQVFQTMINAMAKEVDYGFLALLLKSFTDALHVIGMPLPAQLTSHLLRTCQGSLNDVRARREDRLSQEEYMDEGDLQIYQEEEEEEGTALEHMSKALGMVVKFEPDGQVRAAVDDLWKTIGQVSGMVLGGKGQQH